MEKESGEKDLARLSPLISAAEDLRTESQAVNKKERVSYKTPSNFIVTDVQYSSKTKAIELKSEPTRKQIQKQPYSIMARVETSANSSKRQSNSLLRLSDLIKFKPSPPKQRPHKSPPSKATSSPKRPASTDPLERRTSLTLKDQIPKQHEPQSQKNQTKERIHKLLKESLSSKEKLGAVMDAFDYLIQRNEYLEAENKKLRDTVKKTIARLDGCRERSQESMRSLSQRTQTDVLDQQRIKQHLTSPGETMGKNNLYFDYKNFNPSPLKQSPPSSMFPFKFSPSESTLLQSFNEKFSNRSKNQIHKYLLGREAAEKEAKKGESMEQQAAANSSLRRGTSNVRGDIQQQTSRHETSAVSHPMRAKAEKPKKQQMEQVKVSLGQSHEQFKIKIEAPLNVTNVCINRINSNPNEWHRTCLPKSDILSSFASSYKKS